MFDLLGNYLSTLLHWPSTQAPWPVLFQVQLRTGSDCFVWSLPLHLGFHTGAGNLDMEIPPFQHAGISDATKAQGPAHQGKVWCTCQRSLFTHTSAQPCKFAFLNLKGCKNTYIYIFVNACSWLIIHSQHFTQGIISIWSTGISPLPAPLLSAASC